MFQFKQFKIEQTQCAQKVSEVACIQGSWTPIEASVLDVLDIGSGTGLLSLMLAQRFPNIQIEAVELDEHAFLQGQNNIQQTPFSSRIHCIQSDVKTLQQEKKYDFIICNPPFYEHQLKAKTEAQNIAKHATELGLEDLLHVINQYLKPLAACSILLPFDRKSMLEQYALAQGLYPNRYLYIQHSSNHPTKYFVGIFSRKKTEIDVDVLHVKTEQSYSIEMKKLMQDFYLK